MARRLTTILAADVVGYSRLMAADEAGTLAALKAQRRELIEPRIAEHGGRTVKLMGDGALMEFASVVDAVTFAVEVQRAVAKRNAGVPEDRRIAYRIGINIGDIIVDGDDIYGEGVNIAARLEEMADPGGVCVARNVYNQVRAKVDVALEDLGAQRVKNIPEPVQVYRVCLEAAPEPTSPGEKVAEARPKLPDKPSIAVLPFANMSGDPEQDYFADGMVDDIITELSREPDLFVIARHSSFAYKGRSTDIRQVARELGVRYVLEGSVRKAANRVRLNAQLIEAETNRHLWAERYDRALADVFDVQDELTGTIVNTLLHKFLEIGFDRAARQRPRDMNAYDRVLRAWALNYRFGRAENEQAIREAEAALRIDPAYARAHMALAAARLHSVWLARVEEPKVALDQAREAALKAISADRHDFWGYAALGGAELWLGRHERALSALDRAVALNPNSADAHALRAVFAFNYMGRAEEGLADLEVAMRLNPHHPNWYLLGVARAFYMLGRHEDALPHLERFVDSSPDLITARLLLAANYMAMGRVQEARGEIAAILSRKADFTLADVPPMTPFKRNEDLDRFLDFLRKAGLRE